MAHEIGYPVWWLKENIPATEFDNWQLFFMQKDEGRDKSDWQNAQIVHAIYAANGAKTNLKDHLLIFADNKAKQTPEQAAEHSMSVWMAVTGLAEAQ